MKTYQDYYEQAAVYEPWGTEVKILAMPTRISEDEQWDNKEN